jgi:phenylacetate-coenzyme A ligase PaaK-like adenylate-forming protein
MKMYLFGETTDSRDPLTGEKTGEILGRARQLQSEIERVPVSEILNLFDRLATLWSDPDYPPVRESLERLPAMIGFSPPMIREGIRTMCSLLRRRNMEVRIDCDLGGTGFLDRWTLHRRFQGYMMARPRGVVAHISAGNVFVGGVDSLIQGIVTKNVNIMKMSSVDPLFPRLFAESLRDNDPTGVIHRCLALLHWKGGSADIEDRLKQQCDAIVVYGGGQTIFSYRRNLGLHTRLIEYGPKYSFVAVEAAALHELGIAETASRIAHDGLMWEQSACSSPHLVYVEGRDNALALMEELVVAFDRWHESLPQGTVYEDEAVEITKVRELAKVDAALGLGEFRTGKKGLTTVVFQESGEFQISCLNRTLFVKAVDSLDQVMELVAPMGAYIQTMALLAGEEKAHDFARNICRIGADRIVEPGRMAVRKHGTPHDGTRGLAELVKWVSLSRHAAEADWETGSLWQRYDPDRDGFDFLGSTERDGLTLRRLAAVVEHARIHSPLLAERYGEVRIRDFGDMAQLPLLTGDDYKTYLPPTGEGLLTDPDPSGYVFSSGGTTGLPKSVYRTLEEQHFNAVRLGKGLALSVFGPHDVVANLLFAGNMWASFVSYNQALEHTGCRILPIGGNLEISEIVNYLQIYGANAIITIPSVLLSVGEYVDTHRIALQIDKVSTGGEHLFAEARRYLARVLGIEKFASTGYTTNDTGAIGYQCEFCSGGVHHVHEDLHYVEILDDDDRACDPGRIGRIVVTNLQRRLMPTIRYEVGDLGRWLDDQENCPCGRKTRRFELLGRSDDVLIIGGGNLQPHTVAEAVDRVEGLSSHFQIIAEISGRKDRLRVRAEAMDNGADRNELEKHLKRELYSLSKELRVMYNQGLIADLVTEVVNPGELPRNPRTGKIPLVEDRRRSA